MPANFFIKNKPFSKNAWKPLNDSYNCNFHKNANLAKSFFGASPNDSLWKCNKIALLFLPNINNIMVCWYTMLVTNKART